MDGPEITEELEQGTLSTTGEPVRFWRKQLRAALKGGMPYESYDAETMAAFIEEIQGLFLPEPFQFTPGNEFQEALDILTEKPPKDPLNQLFRELLAAEFNHVSGRGIVGAINLQRVLLG